LDEILFRLITTFDEVPPKFSRAHARPGDLHRRNVHRHRESYGVDLKRVPPKSRPAAWHANCFTFARWQLTRIRLARTPPSTFLFLPIHLSNSPGRIKPPLQTCRRADEAVASDLSRRPVTGISDELRRRAIPPSGGAPCLRYIGYTLGHCQPCICAFVVSDVTSE